MTHIIHKKEACMLLLENEEGKYLIQNRESISKTGELWGFFGGGLEGNETPQECIEREIYEELNFKLRDYFYIGSIIAYSPELKIHIKRNFFYTKTDKPLNEFEVLEGDYAEFRTFSEIKKLTGFMWKGDALEVVEKMISAFKT